ncbi:MULTISPECIES: hypothetical protein [unclassified Microcoleus]|uniref:hypothetical protein n=1 Tax=unclassified Microcoleus TaxID=2642155 RepID=UPI002FD7436D
MSCYPHPPDLIYANSGWGFGSGVGDQYESKTPKEAAWRPIKVKIDTVVGDRTVFIG